MEAHMTRTDRPSPFEALPGEIRNQIFELIIENALKPVKASSLSPSSSPSSSSVSTTQEAPLLRPAGTHPKPTKTSQVQPAWQLAILPKWHGPVSVRLSGIGPLPFLFINKRIYEELSTTIYSNIHSLCIGGYILQHPKDQLSRWDHVYPILMNPYTIRYIKNIKLKLPSIREDIQRMNDPMRGFSITGFIGDRKAPRCDAIMSVVPGLVKCLQDYESLISLEIIISVGMMTPPDFEPLLPLYDLCGRNTSVLFTDFWGHSEPVFHPDFRGYYRSLWRQSIENWDSSWKDCLIRNDRRRNDNFG